MSKPKANAIRLCLFGCALTAHKVGPKHLRLSITRHGIERSVHLCTFPDEPEHQIDDAEYFRKIQEHEKRMEQVANAFLEKSMDKLLAK